MANYVYFYVYVVMRILQFLLLCAYCYCLFVLELNDVKSEIAEEVVGCGGRGACGYEELYKPNGFLGVPSMPTPRSILLLKEGD